MECSIPKICQQAVVILSSQISGGEGKSDVLIVEFSLCCPAGFVLRDIID